MAFLTRDRMKKRLRFALCLALLLALAGCGSGGAAGGKAINQSATVQDVLDAGMAAADAAPTPAPTPAHAERADPGAPQSASETVDVDLTVLSATMVYSEVYNMVTHPEDYIGKTVKMDGAFAYYHDETTGGDYFACIIQDATACCAQGIEFVLAGEHVYPEDYPAPDEEICVVGEFDTYLEGDYSYCTLRNARLL